MPEIFDSTNIQPPFLGPGYPNYPILDQFCRVTGPRISGTNIYPAVVSQLIFQANGLPALRDRETSFVFEPNGILLQPGYYNCRLMNSFQGLPLYVTHCCLGISSSSSSSSRSSSRVSSSSSSPRGIIRVPFNDLTGTTGSGTATSLTWTPTITIPANSLVLIQVALADLSGSSAGTGDVTINGTTMTQDNNTGNGTTDNTKSLAVYQFSYKTTSTIVNPTFSLTNGGPAVIMSMLGEYVTGLSGFVNDFGSNASGNGGSLSNFGSGGATPNTALGSTTTIAKEYIAGAIAVLSGGAFGTLGVSPMSGGQEVDATAAVRLVELFAIVSATGSYQITASNSQGLWSAILTPYS